MTEFEQQVADALRVACQRVHHTAMCVVARFDAPDSSCDCDYCSRVDAAVAVSAAAAIDAIIDRWRKTEVMRASEPQECRAAALAALRGA